MSRFYSYVKEGDVHQVSLGRSRTAFSPAAEPGCASTARPCRICEEARLRILTTTARWLFVACLPFLLVSAGIWWAATSHWLYTSGFEKYNVDGRTGLAAAELDKVAADMIAYFNSSDEFVELTVTRDGQTIDLFTEEEKFHFSDVKRLFQLDFGVLLATAGYVAGYVAWNIYRSNRRRLIRTVLVGSVATLAALGLLGVGVLVDFNWLFLQFHFLAFSNDFWSARGYMLLLFPSGFWYDAVTYCAVAVGGAALGLTAATGVYLWLTRRAGGAAAAGQEKERAQNAGDSRRNPR